MISITIRCVIENVCHGGFASSRLILTTAMWRLIGSTSSLRLNLTADNTFLDSLEESPRRS